MIVFKDGVSAEGLSGEIWHAAYLCEPSFRVYGLDLIVTCGRGGKHSVRRSAHYNGNAMDWRSKHLPPEERVAVLLEIKHILGENYVAILESPDEPYQHFHVHYAPVYDAMNDPHQWAIRA